MKFYAVSPRLLTFPMLDTIFSRGTYLSDGNGSNFSAAMFAAPMAKLISLVSPSADGIIAAACPYILSAIVI